MRISDWSSDVCSSDLGIGAESGVTGQEAPRGPENLLPPEIQRMADSPNMDDRNAAFMEMARIDPKRAFQIQSDARDASLERLKGGQEALRIAASRLDRKSVGEGKGGSVSVDLGGRRILKKK